MTIRVYRVVIEGYVIDQDFGGSGPKLTPADWGTDAIVQRMTGNVQVTETLVDTIEDTNNSPTRRINPVVQAKQEDDHYERLLVEEE